MKNLFRSSEMKGKFLESIRLINCLMTVGLVCRMITCPNQTLRTYFANTKSAACPVGYSQEETIKKIWDRNH